MRKTGLLVLLLFSCSLSAQIPGYYKGRFIFGYSNETQPSLIGPTARRSVGGDRDIEIYGLSNTEFLGFNLTHSVHIEYVIGINTSIGCSYQFFKTGVDYRDSYAQYYHYTGNNKIPLLCRSNNFSLSMKFYQRKFIAPLGRYSRLELTLLNFNVKYDTAAFTEVLPTGYTSAEKRGDGNVTGRTIAVAYTLGKTRIFYDKIVLDWGIRVGIVPGVLPALFRKYGGYNVEDNIRDDTILRLHRYEMFNVHIGIGFLAF